MSLAPPLLRLRAPRPDAALSAAVPSRPLPGCLAIGRGLGSGRAYCLFSGAGAGRRKQEEARRGLESAVDQNKTGFGTWGVETDTRRRRDRRGGPGPAAGGGGRGRSGGGGGGGRGGWFRWFSSGGFWDAAKQTVLTILGIIAVVFLIANFNVLLGAAVYPLLVVLRQIRRAITFAAYCVSRAMSAPASRPKPTPVDSAEVVAAAPVKERARMSAAERVVAKWRSD
ncbi:class E basic helix-loop-helix protein 22 [Triticum urartu]|uniref:class E basic helix-loop-helix protein 22 n=1 Tax=Triticum urartu TaxID=4572 RepID=UPI002044B6B9|nr:class E basic helix-loop-helix protein 22 [Triticum urartu]